MYRLLLICLLALGLTACPTNRRGGDDDDFADDDDAVDDDDAADDDDAVDDDDAADDDDNHPDDDDMADDDDDDPGPPCADSGGVTVTFDTASATSCDEPWTEADVELVFTEGPNCSGCSPSASGGDLWLTPAMIRMDFANVGCTVLRIEIDVTDWTGTGSVEALVVDMDGNMLGTAANSGTGSMETLVIEPGSGIEAGGISGCETQIHEVRLL